MSTITLTASMRSNLASLKSIQNQMNTTQERLSTGKKVNSAIDNASSFYQSRALTNRAADLDALLDSMGQGIQTIQAANEGIEAVTSFIEQLKSVAQSAFAAASGGATGQTIDDYQTQYNNILKEVKTLIGDSGYQGINLLDGGVLNVTFDENRLHILTVTGDDVASKLSASTTSPTDAFHWGTDGVGDINWHANDDYNNYKIVEYTMTAGTATADQPTTLVNGDSLEGWYKVVDGAYVAQHGKYDSSTMGAVTTFFKPTAEADPTYSTTKGADDPASNKMRVNSDPIYNTEGETIASYINKSLDGISKGLDYLRSYTSSLGNN